MPSFDLKGFRQTAPYVAAHRGRTFVLCLDSVVLGHAALDALIQDIAQLHVLGARLILIFGADAQITGGRKMATHGGVPVVSAAALERVCAVIGAAQSDLQARLSQGLIHTTMAGMRLRVLGGNLVFARPHGVHEGRDCAHTGQVRRIESDAIRALLDSDALVLIPPLGFSATGERFYLGAIELARAVAQSVGAQKLLYLHGAGALKAQGKTVRNLTTAQAQKLSTRRAADSAIARMLSAAVDANLSGIERVHLLDGRRDGVLLEELYTHQGSGTMVTASDVHVPRRATIADVGGILELIAPLVDKGVLVARTQQELEMRIHDFWVIESDGLIVGSSSLRPVSDVGGELVCLAVHPEHQKRGHGNALLRALEEAACAAGIQQLYALTTVAMHWFRERGFVEIKPAALPRGHARLYNQQRKSRILAKALEHSDG